MKKNLIIGTATGYKFDQIKEFCHSLKQIAFDGDIVLLVKSDIDASTKEKIEALGIELLLIPSFFISFSNAYGNSRLWKIHYPFHKLLFNVLSLFKSLSTLKYYVRIFHRISASRYCFYHDLISSRRDLYKYILLTDVRDVVFQKDPFKELNGDVLKFYREDNVIADSYYTAYWIKHAFGEKALDKIKDQISICSGTTIGSTSTILNYLKTMIDTQAKITCGTTGLGGFDQGVHNYLIHNNYFPQSTQSSNWNGEVVTLGGTEATFLYNDDKELVNADNSIIPVVHQFDRFPNMELKVLSK